WHQEPIDVLARDGEIVLATTRDPDLYCPEAPDVIRGVDVVMIDRARDQQKENGTPFLLTLARNASIERQPALDLIRQYGQKLFSQLWSAPSVWIMFEKNGDLLSRFGDVTGDPDVDDWSLETLRLVQNPDQPGGFDPTSIPAYTREGYERVQKLKLTSDEAQFASQFNGARTAQQIAKNLRLDLKSARQLLFRFVALEIVECWPGSTAAKPEPKSGMGRLFGPGRERRVQRGGRALMMRKRRILVVDIGGTFVKLLMSDRVEREFASGPRMGPKQFVTNFKETMRGWKFDVASIGFPAPVRNGRILRNPKHLGKGWEHFNFARALGMPMRIVNDAAMQALGSYLGRGRMLFLGLGTGLGSALVWDGNLMSLELGDLPYPKGNIIENYLGIPGLGKFGQKKWKREVLCAVNQLKRAFIADYVVLGGGLVHRFDRLPKEIVRGQNENAFLGGIRLWERKRNSCELKWHLT